MKEQLLLFRESVFEVNLIVSAAHDYYSNPVYGPESNRPYQLTTKYALEEAMKALDKLNEAYKSLKERLDAEDTASTVLEGLLEPLPKETDETFQLIALERFNQIFNYGYTPEYDATHDAADWREFIEYEFDRFPEDPNFDKDLDKFKKIAALAVAAMEQILRAKKNLQEIDKIDPEEGAERDREVDRGE